MKKFVSVLMLSASFGSTALAANERSLIEEKFVDLGHYAKLAYDGFSEHNKAKGCLGEGMLYVGLRTLTREYFADMTNEQTKKAVNAQFLTRDLVTFCGNPGGDLEEAAKAALEVKQILEQ